MKTKFVAFLFILVAVFLAWQHLRQSDVSHTASKTTQYSLSDPSSIWIVVNKSRPLNPRTYAPNDLVVPNIPMRSNITDTEKQVRSIAAHPLETMVQDAVKQGVQFDLQSGYRSYAFQVSLYSSYVQEQGQVVADTQSARPGYSEHQTGLAADLGSVAHPECDIQACFGTTPEGQWLTDNAYKYGFIIRYTEGNQSITGYIAEPWHIRYVGTEVSSAMHNRNIATLEQYFSLPNAPSYN